MQRDHDSEDVPSNPEAGTALLQSFSTTVLGYYVYSTAVLQYVPLTVSWICRLSLFPRSLSNLAVIQRFHNFLYV